MDINNPKTLTQEQHSEVRDREGRELTSGDFCTSIPNSSVQGSTWAVTEDESIELLAKCNDSSPIKTTENNGDLSGVVFENAPQDLSQCLSISGRQEYSKSKSYQVSKTKRKLSVRTAKPKKKAHLNTRHVKKKENQQYSRQLKVFHGYGGNLETFESMTGNESYSFQCRTVQTTIQLSEYTSCVKKTEHEKAEMRHQIKELTDEIYGLEEELKINEKQVKVLLGLNETLRTAKREAINATEAKCPSCVERAENEEKKREELEKLIDENNKLKQECASCVERAENEEKKREEQKKCFEEQIQNLMDENNELKQEAIDHNFKVNDLLTVNAALMMFEEAHNISEEKHKTTQEALFTANAALMVFEEAYNVIETKLNATCNEVNDLRNMKNTLDAALTEEKEAHDATKAELLRISRYDMNKAIEREILDKKTIKEKNDEIDNLNGKIKSNAEHMDKLERKVKEIETDLEKKMEDWKNRESDLLKKTKELTDENNSLSSRSGILVQNENQRLKEALQAEFVVTMEREIDTFRCELDAVKAERNDAKTELNATCNEVNDLRNMKNTLDAALTEEKKAHDATKVKLEAEIDRLNAELNVVRTQATDLRTYNNHLLYNIDRLEGLRDALQQIVKKLEDVVNCLQTEYNVCMQKMGKVENALRSSQLKCRNERKINDDTLKRNDELEDQVQQQQDMVKKLQDEVKRLQDEQALTVAERNQIRQQFLNSRKSNDRLQREVTVLRQSLEGRDEQFRQFIIRLCCPPPDQEVHDNPEPPAELVDINVLWAVELRSSTTNDVPPD